jgi:hypothetical protein
MKLSLATAMMLLATGSAMAADAYDAIYVSDPAVCERAGEPDMNTVLYELKASAVAPRIGVWIEGEMNCAFYDLTMHPSPIAESPKDVDIFATARCTAYDIDFLDTVVVSANSAGINMDNGDTEETPEPKVQLISMRADIKGLTSDDWDYYAGIYTKCDALTVEDLQWKD